jgi:hypothetical protein
MLNTKKYLFVRSGYPLSNAKRQMNKWNVLAYEGFETLMNTKTPSWMEGLKAPTTSFKNQSFDYRMSLNGCQLCNVY